MASQTQQSLVPVHTQQEDATIWGPVASVIVIALANVIAYAANENSWMFKHFLRRLRMPPLLFISNRSAAVRSSACAACFFLTHVCVQCGVANLMYLQKQHVGAMTYTAVHASGISSSTNKSGTAAHSSATQYWQRNMHSACCIV